MLNIISRSIVSKHTRGPRKVVLNLIKGLEEIGYPYVVNAALDATQSLWIHDDPKALKEAMELPSSIAIVAGPNVYTLPSGIPDRIDTSRILWIHPAIWVQKFWEISNSKKLPSVVWPVGVDTANFAPENNTRKDLILVYNKQRPVEDVELVCQALEAQNEKYEIITYGNYNENNYRELLKQSKAIIWIGRSESQGIGFLEALAMNVPALVWNIKQFGQWEGSGHEQFTNEQLTFPLATAAPYFDNTGGIIFSDEKELDSSLSHFLSNLSKFTPRRYVEENLSLKKQATNFINIYKNHFKQDDTNLRATTLANNKKWKNASWCFHLSTQFKDAVRDIIR